MNFSYTNEMQEWLRSVRTFMDQEVYPNEAVYEAQLRAADDPFAYVPEVMESMKAKAKESGLWNLFYPDETYGAGLSNLAYAPLAEEMGRSLIGPEVFNCNAPDTGNMEVLARYGTEAQKEKWLHPLLAGEIRSAFCMTEPEAASSDARNIEASIKKDGSDYILNGTKWWSSGAGDPRCEVLIFMGKTDPDAPTYEQQSMIIVPMDTPGIEVKRMLPVFGYDDAPHGHAEINFHDVRVPESNLLVGEGKGFAIAQGRLGPGRIHHCMRTIGAAERALDILCARADARAPFGRALSEQGVIREWIAEARIEIEQARLLTLQAADRMDKYGNKTAKKEIAMIKVAAPNTALRVLDRAIQTLGAAGVSDDFPLARHYAAIRTLRIADGPDEVHKRAIARQELEEQRKV
ncbi:acyl-CoA dehydrogenase [Salsuginibacillus halophilus]|uniref:Acyl-CoA dehydrogenase n=1 Tax=Salsuginibacillus halophilus TaxID=517424 RepID=A0A2P8HBK2_9BACI|nr:acyl-CoA dehydrogenase family protein [Salsuginibacillus halophilus]PSL43607.1 acyl-CoA dehydrogenase [Salsuginibacillus halophilus]